MYWNAKKAVPCNGGMAFFFCVHMKIFCSAYGSIVFE